MRFPEQVTIIEVGPRDGLQNESTFVPTTTKVAFINELSDSGLKNIEVTSFVSARAIPQLSDNREVFTQITKHPEIAYSALIPNLTGMTQALSAGVKEIAFFTAASDTFNQRNINCSIAQSIERIIPVMEVAKKNALRVRAYISCALGCPYEGSISPKKVLEVTKILLDLKVDEISYGDTIGVGTPKQTLALLSTLEHSISLSQVAMHFHDTYGQALANIYASLSCGVTRFDSAVAGLGGCPYARGATGNIATEDILYLMHGLGIETGVDIYKIVSAGQMICSQIGKKNQSKVANALLGNRC
jgi:hydroxymethylglutaryl-CoA lyase